MFGDKCRTFLLQARPLPDTQSKAQKHWRNSNNQRPNPSLIHQPTHDVKLPLHQFSNASNQVSEIPIQTDRVKVSCHTRHKTDHFEDVPQANRSEWYGKTKPNTTKAHIHQSKNVLQNKINAEKLKPGLDASYDIRAGNG